LRDAQIRAKTSVDTVIVRTAAPKYCYLAIYLAIE
jgi:hypothetical protein